jgi:succinoglycan biosynthesis transport protein ExoP
MSRATVGEGDGRALLRTYAWLIVSITVVTVLAATTVAALRPATYTSFSKVVVNNAKSPLGAPVSTLEPNMGTQREVVLSGEVASRAAGRLGLPPNVAAAGLSVSVPIDTTTLEISYTARSPQAAFKGAKAFTRAYIIFHDETDQETVAEVITKPALSTQPNSTNFALVIGLSLVLGAMIGIGTALVWDRISDRLRGVQDTEARTGIPVLASVPLLRSRKGNRVAALAGTPGEEALGYLTVQLMHTLTARGATSALVTSPSRGAGKTTMAVSVATSLARMGKNVVLVDVLNGSSPLHHALQAHQLEGLRVVTCGADAVPGALSFDLEDMHLLLDRLTKTADVVLLDAPTVLGAPDTALLAEQVDAVLLVVDLRYGFRADATAAVAALSHVEDKLVGCVTNRPRRQQNGFRLSGWRRTRSERRPTSDVPTRPQIARPATEAPQSTSELPRAAPAQEPSDAGLGILRWSERQEDEARSDSDEPDQVEQEHVGNTYEFSDAGDGDQDTDRDSEGHGDLERPEVDSEAEQAPSEPPVKPGSSAQTANGRTARGDSKRRQPRR